MATSSNSPTPPGQDPQAPSSGLTSGAGPDLPGAASPAKPSPKGRARVKGSQQVTGAAAASAPGKGAGAAKPAAKPKAKPAAEGMPSAKGQIAPGGAAAQSAAPGPSPEDAGSGAGEASAGNVGSGQSSAPQSQPQGPRMSDEERQRRIAEVAYRKAQERGFDGDRQVDDWLEAEREFDEGTGSAG